MAGRGCGVPISATYVPVISSYGQGWLAISRDAHLSDAFHGNCPAMAEQRKAIIHTHTHIGASDAGIKKGEGGGVRAQSRVEAGLLVAIRVKLCLACGLGAAVWIGLYRRRGR